MKVAVLAEFYPSDRDPVLGVWAHRQALAARDAGAEVHVLALRRPVPPAATLRGGPRRAAGALASAAFEPLRQDHDGLQIHYVPYLSPPRWRSYPQWGAWAAGPLSLSLERLRRRVGFDLVHAHNAVPSGDAALRALRLLRASGTPLVVSVHGGDVLYTTHRFQKGESAVSRTLAAARLTLANSEGIAALCRDHGALETVVVHLGTDLPARSPKAEGPRPPGDPRRGADAGPAIVTVGHLVARKRHADVMKALAVLSAKHPALRYVIVGDGPERVALEGLAARLGVADRVQMCGQLPPEEALRRARQCTLLAMPSTEEAFGVAYIEAMAAGLPAIGCRGEPGPEEIAAAGGGFVLVPPGDIERLTQRIDELLSSPQRLREEGKRARETVASHFTWARCGQQTVQAYERALR